MTDFLIVYFITAAASLGLGICYRITELVLAWCDLPRFPVFPNEGTSSFLTAVVPFSVIMPATYALFVLIAGIEVTERNTSFEVMNILRLILALLIYDVCSYSIHRVQHRPKHMKIHWVHHKSTMRCLDVYNIHAKDLFEFGIGFVFAALVVGLSIWEIWVMYFVAQYHAALVHSGYSLKWMDWLEDNCCIVGSRFHGAHHYRHDRNYGVFFTFWDDLFGTKASEKVYQQMYQKRVINRDAKKN